MISRRSLLSATAALSLGCGRKHSTGFDGYAFVANAEGKAIAVVDLTAFAVVRHVRLDANPTEVIAHPLTPAVYALTADTGTVHEIDGGRLSVARKLQAGSSAMSMRMPEGDPRFLYVLYRDPRRLACLSLLSAKLEWQIALPAEPHGFDLSPDGRTAAIGFGESGSLGVVDTAARKMDLLQTGTNIGTIRFRADGRVIMAADLAQRMLLLYDVALRRLVVRLPLAVRPDQFCMGGIQQSQLFITGEGLDAVVVVYPYQTQIAETVLAGRKPGAMAASGGTSPYLFISNPTSGDVTIMNLTARKVVAIASVGAEPCYIAITPDDQYALVLNRKSGDVGVLWIRDQMSTRQKTAGLFTMIPVGSAPVCAAIRSA